MIFELDILVLGVTSITSINILDLLIVSNLCKYQIACHTYSFRKRINLMLKIKSTLLVTSKNELAVWSMFVLLSNHNLIQRNV